MNVIAGIASIVRNARIMAFLTIFTALISVANTKTLIIRTKKMTMKTVANKNTLYLPLIKKQWYEMIESGEKTEEYREIKTYWWKRLI